MAAQNSLFYTEKKSQSLAGPDVATPAAPVQLVSSRHLTVGGESTYPGGLQPG